MNALSTFLRSAAIAGVTLAASSVIHAQGGAPTSADQLKYRCIVLGELSACPWNAPAAAKDGTVPGPYARYLIDKGVARDEAIAQAKAIGEEPVPTGRQEARVR